MREMVIKYALLGAASFVLVSANQSQAADFLLQKAGSQQAAMVPPQGMMLLAMGERQKEPELPPSPPEKTSPHISGGVNSSATDYGTDIPITPDMAKRLNMSSPQGDGHMHEEDADELKGDAHMHEHGRFVPPEHLLKLRASAESGDAGAMGELGSFYHEGKGVERDLRKAFYWFRQAAPKGDVLSMIYLGRYYRGEFPELKIAKDYDEAEKWLQEAAKTEDMTAMGHLGTLLFERARNGEPERREEASWWYNRATGGEWDRDYVPPGMKGDSEEEIPEADAEPKAADEDE